MGTLQGRHATFSLAVLIAGTLGAPAFGLDANCLRLASSFKPGETSRLFYLDKSVRPATWRSAMPDAVFEPGSDIEFTYASRELIDAERSGVLIVKTGRETSGGPPATPPRRVVLRRDEIEASANRCGLISPFTHSGSSISSRSYDDYYDYGYRIRDDVDRAILDEFHVVYAARRQGCKATNDTNSDNAFQLDFRSNRSQFSFDPLVVKYGMYNQLAAFFSVTSAVAASSGLADQSVEIHRYEIATSGAACVPFHVKLTGPHFFLRIDDLEDRVDGGIRLIRSEESSWMLTH